jgi:outer membrane protein TolC
LHRSQVVPRVPRKVPVGLPGSLVRRRPDVREAEARLHKATAQTGVAVRASILT